MLTQKDIELNVIVYTRSDIVSWNLGGDRNGNGASRSDATTERAQRASNGFLFFAFFFLPVSVTGDRFSRRENLMEKSEMSDTDAPAIRQAIHSSTIVVSPFRRTHEIGAS